ncbi:hypothetical protein BD779DRAFT_1548578, partial [Infundibulicybe gibba]
VPSLPSKCLAYIGRVGVERTYVPHPAPRSKCADPCEHPFLYCLGCCACVGWGGAPVPPCVTENLPRVSASAPAFRKRATYH